MKKEHLTTEGRMRTIYPYAAAAHEAGHAVVALHSGIGVMGVFWHNTRPNFGCLGVKVMTGLAHSTVRGRVGAGGMAGEIIRRGKTEAARAAVTGSKCWRQDQMIFGEVCLLDYLDEAIEIVETYPQVQRRLAKRILKNLRQQDMIDMVKAVNRRDSGLWEWGPEIVSKQEILEIWKSYGGK